MADWISMPRSVSVICAVVGSLGVVAVAPTPSVAASLKGKTAAGHKVTLDLKGQKITKLRTWVYLRCHETPGRGHKQGLERFDPPGSWIANGKSQNRQASAGSAVANRTLTFGYHVKAKRDKAGVRGTLHLTFTWADYNPLTHGIDSWLCDGRTTFSAR